jgi:hypothetical protein
VTVLRGDNKGRMQIGHGIVGETWSDIIASRGASPRHGNSDAGRLSRLGRSRPMMHGANVDRIMLRLAGPASRYRALSRQIKAKGGCALPASRPENLRRQIVRLEIVADAEPDGLKGRMQGDQRIARRGRTGTGADGMQADVFRERAQIGVSVLEPQGQIWRDQGLDTAAAGRASPGGAPRAAAGNGSTGDAAQAIDFMGRVAERPADIAEGNLAGAVNQGPGRHKPAPNDRGLSRPLPD